MYPAHIRETGERQTVREHCRKTAALAAGALESIGLEKSAYLAGLLHDAGKNKKEYEDYLLEAAAGGSVVRGSVNHTFAGARFLLDAGQCRRLQAQLLSIMDSEKDSLRFYYLGKQYEKKVEHFGAKSSYLPEDPLIL